MPESIKRHRPFATVDSGFRRGDRPRRWASFTWAGWFFIRLYWDDRYVGTPGNARPHRSVHVRIYDTIFTIGGFPAHDAD